MSEFKCSEIEELLVDFVDGGLDAAQRAMVERHIEHCNGCREIVFDLESSLDSVLGVWEENLSAMDEAGCKIAAKGGVQKLWLGAFGSVAAAVLVLLCLNLGSGNGGENDQQEELVPIDQLMAQIDYEIEMAGSAARLLASSERLAQDDGLRGTAVEQYKFIAESYPGTAAAERAKRLIE